ncbi:hypothetical protein, partial [Salmonella enterica]|uniref:hypothetical protein n=1 Tax=Salmonella enterica TaxID=28901 RepID=UPI002A74FF44
PRRRITAPSPARSNTPTAQAVKIDDIEGTADRDGQSRRRRGAESPPRRQHVQTPRRLRR